MTPQKLIKKEALGRMKGHWATALGILCVPLTLWVVLAFGLEYALFCTGTLSMDTGSLNFSPAGVAAIGGCALAIALVFVFGIRPLLLGVRRWACAMAFGNNTGAGTCLYYFSRAEYGRCLSYSLRLIGQILLRTVAILAVVCGFTALCAWAIDPALLGTLFSRGASQVSAQKLALLTALFSLALIVGTLVLLGLCLRFFLADYLFITERDLNCIAQSAMMMRGRKGFCWKLFFSFFWWALLCVLAFPLLFVVPYAFVSFAVARKWMVYNFRNPPQPAPMYDYAK